MELSTDESPSDKDGETLVKYRDRILATYYTGIADLPLQPEITVQCPFDKNCGLTCKFDNIGMFECQTCGKSGVHAGDYVRLMEGISQGNIAKQIKWLLNDNKSSKERIPEKTEFEQWNNDLHESKNSEIYEFLKKDNGISEQTITDLNIVFNGSNELVIPIPNATNYGFAGAWLIGVDGGKLSGEIRSVGCVVVWGYHNLRNSVEGTTVVCVGNILDAILLQQNGVLAVGFPLHTSSWHPELVGLFKKKNIVLCFSDSEQETLVSETILLDVLENADSVKKIVYSSGLLPNRLSSVAEYFVKHGKSIIDFHKALKSFYTVPKNTKRILGEIQNERLAKVKTLKVRPAQDYVDGKLYYAISIGNTYYLIDSTGDVHKLDELKSMGIDLATSEFPASNFSSDGISNYLQRAGRANASSVFQSIRDHLQK